jgi:hypothetical protein
VLSPYPDCSSGHRRHCLQWRRLSQPRGSPRRCSQSLQPDELGRRGLGGVVPDMVYSRRSSENSRLDLRVGPVTMVSEKTGRVAERGGRFGPRRSRRSFPRLGVRIEPNRLTGGQFARGRDAINAHASMVFVGNSALVRPLTRWSRRAICSLRFRSGWSIPPFFDRFRAYVPG